MEEKRKIKIGVVGVGRGTTFMNHANTPAALELVALCDRDEERLLACQKSRGANIRTYTDYDEFLKDEEMEAVVLVNTFNMHAPFAIKALKAGKHVMSETSAMGTLAEGVELCKAVEESGKIYMFAENYGFTKCGLEMHRLYEKGEIGEVMYAEAEYNHPSTGTSPTSYPVVTSPYHWRLWLPPTYYCTHAMGPMMYVTGRMPKKVSAQSIVMDQNAHAIRDDGAVMLVTMDNGAVFRTMGNAFPGHSYWYRFHGTEGAMELERGPKAFGPGHMRVWHEPLHLSGDRVSETVYEPQWPLRDQDLVINRYGHAGSDFWTSYYFGEAIRNGTTPMIDVYQACAMTAVGICGWRSVRKHGEEVEIPDFRDKTAREKYASDNESPFPDQPNATFISPTTRPHLQTYEACEKMAKLIFEEKHDYYESWRKYLVK